MGRWVGSRVPHQYERSVHALTSPVSAHIVRLWPQPSRQQVVPSALKAPSHKERGGETGGGGGVQNEQPEHAEAARCGKRDS